MGVFAVVIPGIVPRRRSRIHHRRTGTVIYPELTCVDGPNRRIGFDETECRRSSTVVNATESKGRLPEGLAGRAEPVGPVRGEA